MTRRVRHQNTESVDNYLKAILTLGEGKDARVTIKALAQRLQVAPASVTNMLQKLSALPLPPVDYQRHGGVQLSSSGRLRALEIVRHHRLLETFLYEVLNYPIDELHEEAERLEHFISERFEERIATKLGHPRIDPHGHAIPTMDGEMSAGNAISLADVKAAGNYVIESICDSNPLNLQWIEASGIVPGARLRVRSFASAEGYSVSIGRSSRAFALSPQIAADLRVTPAGRSNAAIG